MIPISRNELLQKLSPHEQRQVDLVSIRTINWMFVAYLATKGVNSKEHPLKKEMERIRVYMNRGKEVIGRGKVSQLDSSVASRFMNAEAFDVIQQLFSKNSQVHRQTFSTW